MKESSKGFLNHEVDKLEKRENKLYDMAANDGRSPFYRDYTRILHSCAYRRLKHKTQVFFNIDNDHVCTRIEHVNHVESVSYSIAKGLDLDTELTRAIACGHDLGHAPFGHAGEIVIDKRVKEELSNQYYTENEIDKEKIGDIKLFWHEKNGLRFVDDIELLPDSSGVEKNLNLTYAVRDGIISHCGEVKAEPIMPREDYIDLKHFNIPGQYNAYTWEGCVVKVSDKIAYLGRDIEDARVLGFLDEKALNELALLSSKYTEKKIVNTTTLMHTLIGDIIENSTPEKGICLSDEKTQLIEKVKDFNYKYIYGNKLFDTYKGYVEFILNKIFDKLLEAYDAENTINNLKDTYGKYYKKLSKYFGDWLEKYCDCKITNNKNGEINEIKYENKKIYKDLKNKDDYIWAIADFISGMTDSFAISIFNELISFGK